MIFDDCYIYNVSLTRLAVAKGIFICEKNEYSSSLSWCYIQNPRPENIQKVKKMAIVPGLLILENYWRFAPNFASDDE